MGDDEEWVYAEAITDDLIERGFVCGWPDRGEVFAVVRALIAAGYEVYQ